MRHAAASFEHAFALCAALTCVSCGGSPSPSASDAKEQAEPAVRPPAAAPAAPAGHAQLAPRAPGALDAKRLPEDPEAAKRATAQWNEHLEEEERERQLLFDRDRIPEHRSLIALILSARARYDRAKTEAALGAARAAMPAQLAAIRERVAKIDPWGNSSRLLGDYKALEAALAASYPEAKLAALRGDGEPLRSAKASIDERVHEMREWLEAAKKATGEGGEGEAEREREEEEREARLRE